MVAPVAAGRWLSSNSRAGSEYVLIKAVNILMQHGAGWQFNMLVQERHSKATNHCRHNKP
jgi:hypothetical protein